jgi:O-antigen/teichoic acid export membrane protein
MERDIASGFLSVFSAKLATVLLTVAITPVLVRLLGSGGYGEYAFVLAAVGLAMIVVNAGIYDGVRKFVAEDRSAPDAGTVAGAGANPRDDRWEAHVIGYYLRLAAVFVGAAAGIVLLLSATGALSDLAPTIERYALLVAALLVGRQLFQTVRGGLMGLGLEVYSESFLVLRKLGFAVIGLSLAAAGWRVTGVLVGHVLASIAGGLLALLVLARRVDLTAALRRAPPSFPRRSLAVFNAESVVLILLTASLYHVDVLLLHGMRGSQETGYYRAALLVAEFLWFAPFALQTVLLHSTAELWSQGRTERITELAARVTRYTLSLTVLLALGIGALAGPLVRLYFGPAFGAASTAVVLLLPGAVGFAVARPIYAVGQGRGRLRLLVAATGAAAALNLLLNLLLIPRYGMHGAAVATSVGYGSMFVLHVAAARAIGFDPVADLRAARLAAVVLVSAPVILGLAHLLPSPLVSLAVVPPVGAAVFAVAALSVGLVDGAELEGLLGRLPDVVARPLRSLVSRLG